MQVQEAVLPNGATPGRYTQVAVPRWFNVPLRFPDFLSTQNVNNLLALFHFNVGDCRVLPATHVIDYHEQQIDVDRQCYYIEVNCASVEEAKKRAIVLAYLTYDLRTHNFVRLSTSKMMANPHLMNKMYAIFDKFNVECIDREPGQPDLKAVIATQAQQPHAGFLCTDKDQGEMRFHERYKTLRLNEKFVHLTVAGDLEEKLMDREHMQLAARLEFENAQGPKNAALQGLSFMETRKINE